MKTTAEKIAVMQAYEDGKTIQVSMRGFASGVTPCELSKKSVKNPLWDWETYDYNIKKEPRTFYVNEYKDGSFGAAHSSADRAAIILANTYCGGRTIKVVEVLD